MLDTSDLALKTSPLAPPTAVTYAELQRAFDHFNKTLFDDQLPPCLLTLQREKKSYGYFSHRRFVSSDEGQRFTDEIALNPSYFAYAGLLETLQTIAHEMVHLWQYHFGKPGRGRYHNKQFADKMKEIGLMPSSTGKPGGAETGEKMADYPIPGGAFLSACDALTTDAFRISWHDRYAAVGAAADPESIAELVRAGVIVAGQEARPSGATRVKYSCPVTRTNVWGKPGLQLFVTTDDGATLHPLRESGAVPKDAA